MPPIVDIRTEDGGILTTNLPINPGGVNPFANYAGLTAAATVNGQGVGGPTIIALIKLVAKSSGMFEWKASAVQAAAAATEVVTWTVTTQTSAAGTAVNTTGGTSAIGYSSSGTQSSAGDTPANLIVLSSNAAAGTGIVIVGGGGGELTQFSQAKTVGTAAVGDSFGSGGIAQNAIASIVNGPGSTKQFTIGANVLFLLKVTNSATNRVVTAINFEAWELSTT